MGQRSALRIVTVCTGNAARSPMSEVLLTSALPGCEITSVGTFAVEGQPVSWRTRAGLEAVRPDISPGITRHRSRQLSAGTVDGADIALCMASEHVAYIRRTLPDVAPRAGTIRRLVRDLPEGNLADVAARVASLGLEGVELGEWEDVEDPAGGEVDGFVRCARELDGLVGELAVRLGASAV